MIHVLVILAALVALLVPAPFALAHGSRAVHARRHDACLRRIAALEIDLGMRESEERSFADLVSTVDWKTRRPAFPRTPPEWAHRTNSALRLPQSEPTTENEKAWQKNRKRLAKIPPSPYRRRARD